MTQYKTQYGKTEHGDKDEWRTPNEIFNPLNDVFHFGLDAAANNDNTKCILYYGIDKDGLARDWRVNGPVFCNPPHTNGQYGDWINKAAEEWEARSVTSVLVLPFNSETKAFSGVWDNASHILLPYKRIKYLLPNGTVGGSPTFYSCIPIFGGLWLANNHYAKLMQIGRILDLRKGLIKRA